MRYGLDKPTPLSQERPTHCHWCGGSLARLLHIYKGQDCERYYDSIECLSRGEDRAIRYRATLAGKVS